VAKRQDLDFQRSSRSEQSDQSAKIAHRAKASPDSQFLTSRFWFPVGTAISAANSRRVRPIEDGGHARGHTRPYHVSFAHRAAHIGPLILDLRRQLVAIFHPTAARPRHGTYLTSSSASKSTLAR
jgi:hypothetical protein